MRTTEAYGGHEIPPVLVVYFCKSRGGRWVGDDRRDLSISGRGKTMMAASRHRGTVMGHVALMGYVGKAGACAGAGVGGWVVVLGYRDCWAALAFFISSFFLIPFLFPISIYTLCTYACIHVLPTCMHPYGIH